MEIPIYPISFNGYNGTIEVSDGTLKFELPRTIASGTMGNASFPIKRYYLSLLTPDRENIDFELYRFLYGEWFDWYLLSLAYDSPLVTSELKESTKKEITNMGI
ncbi:MAG: hypothetical protein M3004_09640 [Bacteroidota bacterium]|nr:hypothetical protein [Bacteroidota bacterium]